MDLNPKAMREGEIRYPYVEFDRFHFTLSLGVGFMAKEMLRVSYIWNSI